MGLIGTLNLAIGLLSNGLSYLRILALGLVTGAIAFAVNQVAIEMSKLFPIWLGIPVMIVILFMGHLVSIALNVLGAFIHSGRLQFIEFFSQFFEGGGRSFAPFAKSIPR
jgi:V/A-type H+-transporting ATPase subunit I